MRTLLAFALLASGPILLLACGDDTEESSGEFIAACEDFCEGYLSLECNMTGTSVEQCQSACPYQERQLAGYCVAEYTATFKCANEGGFECVNGNPVPNAACIAESTALNECLTTAGCERFCDNGGDACSSGDCIQTCEADKAELESCSFQYDSLLTCYAESGVECDGGVPSPAGCTEEILQVGDCLSDFGQAACTGWCWAAERLGCGDGCLADCEEKIADPTCGSDYAQIIDCGLFFDAAGCSGDELVATDCQFEVDNYESCLAGQ
jgi:hypothetical protein